MLCQDCKKRSTCTEICPELSRYLEKKPKDRLYSDRHIRRVEVPYSPEYLDEMLPLQAIERIKGRQRKKSSEKE